jgi:hypothetical protein
MRWRVSISACLGVVFISALGLAALRSPSRYSVTATAWALLSCLSVSVVGALFSRGTPRVFWTGFAVFGWPATLVSLGSRGTDGLMSPLLMGIHYLFMQSVSYVHYDYLALVCYQLLVLAFAFVGGLTALWFAARRDPAQDTAS